MTPDQIDLARRAAACRRWRWMPGMGVRRWSDSDGLSAITRVNVRAERTTFWMSEGWLPDLSDPATLGCMLDIVREIHGRSTVIRLVGTDGQGGEEWAICDRAPGGMAAPSIYGFASELEALVTALEAAP